MKKINYLLHAYSPNNSGDGLLVELSVRQIRKLSQEPIRIVCIDPDGFKKIYREGDCQHISILRYVGELLLNATQGVQCTFYGVGGGYIRSSTIKEGIKTVLAHGSQIACAITLFPRAHKTYFPQSIGPLNGFCGMILKRLASKLTLVFARDEKTMQELKELKQLRRAPDLVAIEILDNAPYYPSKSPEEKIGLIFRALPSHKASTEYIDNLKQLKSRIPNSQLVLQSHGRGNDDSSFYSTFFGEECAITRSEFLKGTKACTISVRLHGSLESILAGTPSIHLSYERKGISAYSDLGISDYCFQSTNFDPAVVAGKAECLMKDSSEFWDSINRAALSFRNPIVQKHQ